MDIDRARTFLEIVHTGSFLKASEQLNITQTTVSARIRTLEEALWRKLFVRTRNGAALTPAGREFERFAQSFVQVWERARQQLTVPPGRTSVVAVGALKRVEGAPEFTYPAYAVYPEAAEGRRDVQDALFDLKQVAH